MDVLAAADVVAAEDTRNTAHLLSHHAIRAKQLIAVHQHNERGAADKIIALLQAGQSVAFVSDAGTPAVSDPGALLVQAVLAAGLRVIPIPGASAVVAALSAAGLNDAHFLFMDFCRTSPPRAAPLCKPCKSMLVRWYFMRLRIASSNALPTCARCWVASGRSCWRARSQNCSRPSTLAV